MHLTQLLKAGAVLSAYSVALVLTKISVHPGIQVSAWVGDNVEYRYVGAMAENKGGPAGSLNKFYDGHGFNEATTTAEPPRVAAILRSLTRVG